MDHNKEQSKESEHATDHRKTDAQRKEGQREQDPGTGYNRRRDPDVKQLKNSISRHKWEH